MAKTAFPIVESSSVPNVLLVGNPNAGKTSLFNALTGLRAKTANYPGITVVVRVGRLQLSHGPVNLLDLPGLYSLDAMTPEEQVAELALSDQRDGESGSVILLVLDATNLTRNLLLASQVLERGHPTIAVLSLLDAARAAEIETDSEALSSELGCPVVPVSARTGEGIYRLRCELDNLLNAGQITAPACSCDAVCGGCPYSARYEWAEGVVEKAVTQPNAKYPAARSTIDRYLTSPLYGIAVFVAVMLFVFFLIFSLADIPMTMIDEGVGATAEFVRRVIPQETAYRTPWGIGVFASSMLVFAGCYWAAGVSWRWYSAGAACLVSLAVALIPMRDVSSLVTDGVITGVGGVIVFLPQIAILFFFISLLEDSGYMARAAFVMQRVMRWVGLPGKAFVPMLSAHACAIPGIMAARVIDNWRDRLVTILVLPFLTCSARLPVYGMVAALLFGDSSWKAALVFLGAYLLGIGAMLATAFALKKTLLAGETAPLVIELPPYRRPSLRNALLTTLDRASVFVRKAGTTILLISVILWALAHYPKQEAEFLPKTVADEVAALQATNDGEALVRADKLLASEQLSYSFAGRIGRSIGPLTQPLGFDWKINVGVLSSFAAREVVVSTMAILYGGGEDDGTLLVALRNQRRSNGEPVFDTATSLSLLVFFVLAMQCLPTQVVTRRETGSWKWAILQLVFMTLLAYLGALLTFQAVSLI